MDNYYNLFPKTYPVKMVISKFFAFKFYIEFFIDIKNNGKSWSKHLQDVVECFKLPLEIKVDFFCLTTSKTRFKKVSTLFWSFFREHDLLWPSEGTSSNKTTIIESDNDLEELTSEFSDFPHEKILEAHYACRLRDCTSDIQIRSVLGMRIFLTRFNYESQYESFQ